MPHDFFQELWDKISRVMTIFTSFRQIQDAKVGSVRSVFQVFKAIQQGCIVGPKGFDDNFSFNKSVENSHLWGFLLQQVGPEKN